MDGQTDGRTMDMKVLINRMDGGETAGGAAVEVKMLRVNDDGHKKTNGLFYRVGVGTIAPVWAGPGPGAAVRSLWGQKQTVSEN